jgi:DNA-binding response OmpR family regulator
MMSQSPLILVIDDSPTIRRMVECHLSQSGYRVVLAPDADRGLATAAEVHPDLILLDHQLPGTTGDEVCRKLLQDEKTARVPVLVSSALRNRAFSMYAEFPNVVDQIPKPFTPELLKSGVSNALQTGAMVVQAQRTGCAMPESVSEEVDATLSGQSTEFPLRAVLDFLNNAQVDGRLTFESGNDRLRFGVSGGRIQAVYSPTVASDRVARFLPREMSDLAPLVSVTLGEHQDASTSGLVKLLERSLSDPRRLRLLLRAQAAVLTYMALTGEHGPFAFEPRVSLPPMFQAFPLQSSLPALAVEGVRRCVDGQEFAGLGEKTYARLSPRGGCVDRVGLSPADLRVHTLLDGQEPLGAIAAKAGVPLPDACAVVRGLEMVGQAERKSPAAGESILLVDDDPETVRIAAKALGPDGEGFPLRHVRDRVAAQLLVRRTPFALVILPTDTPDQESFYHSIREHTPAATRFIGLVTIDDEGQLERLDRLGLDGVVHRPPSESDLRASVRQLLGAGEVAVTQ